MNNQLNNDLLTDDREIIDSQTKTFMPLWLSLLYIFVPVLLALLFNFNKTIFAVLLALLISIKVLGLIRLLFNFNEVKYLRNFVFDILKYSSIIVLIIGVLVNNQLLSVIGIIVIFLLSIVSIVIDSKLMKSEKNEVKLTYVLSNITSIGSTLFILVCLLNFI